MNYDIKISDDQPTDSIWAMITKDERAAIELNSDAVYDIQFPPLKYKGAIKHKGLTVTGIVMREWLDRVNMFACDIYYFMKK